MRFIVNSQIAHIKVIPVSNDNVKTCALEYKAIKIRRTVQVDNGGSAGVNKACNCKTSVVFNTAECNGIGVCGKIDCCCACNVITGSKHYCTAGCCNSSYSFFNGCNACSCSETVVCILAIAYARVKLCKVNGGSLFLRLNNFVTAGADDFICAGICVLGPYIVGIFVVSKVKFKLNGFQKLTATFTCNFSYAVSLTCGSGDRSLSHIKMLASKVCAATVALLVSIFVNVAAKLILCCTVSRISGRNNCIVAKVYESFCGSLCSIASIVGIYSPYSGGSRSLIGNAVKICNTFEKNEVYIICISIALCIAAINRTVHFSYSCSTINSDGCIGVSGEKTAVDTEGRNGRNIDRILLCLRTNSDLCST